LYQGTPFAFANALAVEPAEQGIAVFLGPVGQVDDERFNLLSGGFAEGFGSAEIDRIGLDEVGVELVTGPSFCTKRCESLHHSFGL
jgi:hypothetical protein